MLIRLVVVTLLLMAACNAADVTFIQTGPQCGSLPESCGVSGNDSCCNSPEVVGGMFDRSFDLASDNNSGTMSARATVSSFRLDKYEVTVGRFRVFVNAGMGTQQNPPEMNAGSHPKITGSGWDAKWNGDLVANTAALVASIECESTYQTWTNSPGANEDRPMNCITWYEAMAFCAWDGGYLPTEAEWNYAATGGGQQRAYPWSSPADSLILDGSRASYDDGTNCVGDGMPNCALTDLVPVGTKLAGDGLWGQSDLAGNVSEWTLDWYSSDYPVPCTDCANLNISSYRVFRGGSFFTDATNLRAGVRNITTPESRYDFIGVRCARTP